MLAYPNIFDNISILYTASTLPRAIQYMTEHTPSQHLLAIWLFACCGILFAMILLGGVTRLTGSGLSMVQWNPIFGILPPLTQAEWDTVFQLYQQSPEFKAYNFLMDIEGFKSIFWFEYAHRILGRIIGVIFLLGILLFLAKRMIDKTMLIKLVSMFVLGGMQGVLGWYMVQSGLIDVPHVSQYRLTAHFGLAVLIYGYMFWVALGLYFPRDASPVTAKSRRQLLLFSRVICGLVFITLLSGGFVAGLKAGFAYNTFPLMDGQIIPDGILRIEPAWKNFFENVTTVQFDHRVLATMLFLLIPTFWWLSRQVELPPRAHLGTHLLLGALFLQVALGISTILSHVYIPLASAHQGGSLLLLMAALFVTHQLSDDLS
ncbi:Heme A synthase, cytochrome oxidase biogenesis protein Cox15-CtaA [hydrothermal vent metagenome]|uniref:Heme A synthase, cytochrome oxidase biogenesis protein Cox15-CtaA n=1 Tax=hydrothermal vent metagenome TaxID=652676 RepID=A0A3B1B8R5_9ZZZZ